MGRAPLNPIVVRREPVQAVRPGGSWEAQCTCDIDDLPLVQDALVASCGGDGPFHRTDGDVVEMYGTHNTRTAAEGTIRRWMAVVERAAT